MEDFLASFNHFVALSHINPSFFILQKEKAVKETKSEHFLPFLQKALRKPASGLAQTAARANISLGV